MGCLSHMAGSQRCRACRYMKGAPKQDAYRAAMSMQNHAGEIFGGDEFSARHGGFTRCTLTQYALTRYFCGKDLADAGELPCPA